MSKSIATPQGGKKNNIQLIQLLFNFCTQLMLETTFVISAALKIIGTIKVYKVHR